MDGKDQDVRRMQILEANNLTYKFSDVLNLSQNRTLKKQNFDTRSFTLPGAGQAVCTWNTGLDLIDTRNSYLKFRLDLPTATATPAVTYTFGTASAMNLIREVKVMSASGVELARTQNANVFHAHYSAARHSAQWRSTVGRLMGVGQPAIAPSGNATFIIPLCELDPFFEFYDGKLLPQNLASGLRLEITWEDLATAFVSSGAVTAANAILSYTVSQIEIRTESVSLTDGAIASINREASKSGIELTYDKVYTTEKNVGTNQTEHIEVKMPVSFARGVFNVILPTASRGDIAADSFQSLVYDHTSAQIRLGNNYYPHQPITNVQEAYHNYLKHWNKLKQHSSESSVTFTDFNDFKGAVCSKFQADDTLSMSGLKINSSRICEVSWSRTGADAATSFTFLIYTALARASLSNVNVKT